MQKEEIVLYIYHINTENNNTENKSGGFLGEMPEGGAPKQQGKQLSSAFLAKAASHYLAHHCPRDFAPAFGQEGAVSFRTRKGSHGKPYFPDLPWLHFSVSHSGEYWACAMASTEVGLDLQMHTRGRKEQISARFFHPWENEYLRSCGYEGFFDIWSAKESYVKYTGQGIDENFAAFSAALPTALSSQINGVQLKHIPFFPGCSLCLCAPRIDNVVIHYEEQNP